MALVGIGVKIVKVLIGDTDMVVNYDVVVEIKKMRINNGQN